MDARANLPAVALRKPLEMPTMRYSRYVLNHIPSSVDGERAELQLYRGGHMFFTDPQSRKAFTADARTMYAWP